MSAKRTAKRETTPRVAVLVDRSRDWMAAHGVIGLEPDDVYHTTDNRVPLQARTLARYDVLVVAGQGLATYSARETKAITHFVRAGGGLLLAATAGVFERYTGRPAADMAVAALARLFGIEFLSPGEAAGRLTTGVFLVKGYPPESVRVHGVPAMRGIRAYDVHLDGWSPVRAQRSGTVLISHRRTGEAAAVALPFGKGRVVAVGDTGFFEHSPRLCRRLIDYLAAGRARQGKRKLPYEIATLRKTRRSGNIEIRYPHSVADRVPAVRRIARKVIPYLESLVPPEPRKGAKKKPPPPRKFGIDLAPSCSFGPGSSGWWRSGIIRATVGAHTTDAEMAFAMGVGIGDRLARRRGARWEPEGTVLWRHALRCYLGLAAMREAGFEAEAERLGEQFERDSRRRMKGVDAARFYGEGKDEPGLWIWRELERRYGRDILSRFLKAIPKKCDWRAGQDPLFTPTDLAIHFLSRAAKTDLYPWFAEQGATVHPMPLSRFGSKEFKEGVKRSLRRLIADAGASASERLDAVRSLIARLRAEKRTLATAARQLRSAEPARRLVGAAWLAGVRDERGPGALRSLAGLGDDEGMAAMAALLLVEQGDRAAADRLVELAGGQDHRFQLDASYQLGRIGDERAQEFSFEAIRRADGRKACRMEARYGREVRVWPVVDGYRVANVFSMDTLAHMPANTHVSMFYVCWVHTAIKWRRKGLARLALRRSLADPLAGRCSCFALGTGTRNVAHVLYRDVGLVDAPVWEGLACELESAPPPAKAAGHRVRAYRRGDEDAMARLFNECYGESCAIRPRRPVPIEPGPVVLLAFRGRRPVAYVVAHCWQESAHIQELAWLPKQKEHPKAVRCLMGRLHARLKKQGVKKVDAYSAPEVLGPLLQPLGYSARRSGGLELIGIINLPQFLEEIRPLLERRLAKDQWVGSVALCGEKHRAGLAIRKGRVKVIGKPPKDAAVTLSGSDDAITRIVTGVETPFKVYWEMNLQIEPALTDTTRELLDKLFPRAKICAWAWG